MEPEPRISIRRERGYVFSIDFGALIPHLTVDEAEPIGDGEGPAPEQLVVAGVANCLCASLVFALGKFGQNADGLHAEASCVLGRNAEGRLRIDAIEVAITLGAPIADPDRTARALAQFERFCTVSESVKAGVPVSVTVSDQEGRRLK
ncbi:MAG: peroxiredoxin [Ancylobacter novellus]|uniref:Peroxiredoxin n=1 Tax=Ancylobacter novellus TaxID=921 RepID=A0A2W5MBH1_ANCNO|nr:MAG: peroxiredoxin [Ancylobacter novellus]